MADRVYIFDTTLRDGEQSPGCSMTVSEKLKMAAKLVDLGVDVVVLLLQLVLVLLILTTVEQFISMAYKLPQLAVVVHRHSLIINQLVLT